MLACTDPRRRVYTRLRFTFALFDTFFGIPIARLADRMNRKSIVAAGVIAWSLMATCCGLAKNFVQLCFARAGGGLVVAAISAEGKTFTVG